MKILSIECSAVPCSAAIIEDEKIIASSFVNVKLTHSETLLPLVDSILKSSKTDINEIDGFAVSNGPGSFTGIRIGISAIKGLAAPLNKQCVGVSTLLSMAYNFKDTNGTVCAVMDARCNQVYNALFNVKDGVITRLTDDRAIMCEDLAKEINELNSDNIIIVGDGTEIFWQYVKSNQNVKKSDITRRYQNATSVALTALEMFKSGNTTTASQLLPVYLRLPQAERELKLKKEKEL